MVTSLPDRDYQLDRCLAPALPLLGALRPLDGLPRLPAQPDSRALPANRIELGGGAYGVGSTARLITGAALIIIAVFAGFASGELVEFQQMGFGVAVSLLIDATLIRSVLLPNTMQLLGDRNWYLPSWLEWLPHLEVEGSTSAPNVAARS